MEAVLAGEAKFEMGICFRGFRIHSGSGHLGSGWDGLGLALFLTPKRRNPTLQAPEPGGCVPGQSSWA